MHLQYIHLKNTFVLYKRTEGVVLMHFNLLIVSFVAVGMADLGKQANKLLGLTVFLAYASTILAGYIAYFFGVSILPNFIHPFSGSVADVNPYDPFLTIKVTPVFDVMTGLMLAFILGIGMANLKIGTAGKLLSVLREVRDIITKAMQQLIISLHFSQDSFGTATNVAGDQALSMIVDKVRGHNIDTVGDSGEASA